MILYRYLSLSSALKSLEADNLKFGLMKDFNDPFEFLHRFEVNMSPERHLKLMQKRRLNESHGFICFSHEDTLTDPLLWSHYADHHRGIALGFEFSEQYSEVKVKSPVGTNVLEGLGGAHAVEVDYCNNQRIDISDVNESELVLSEKAAKLWYTKGLSWEYEKEWRVRYPLDSTESKNGFHFISTKQVPPSKIVLGWRCELRSSYFKSWLKAASLENWAWDLTKVSRMVPHATEYSLEEACCIKMVGAEMSPQLTLEKS